MVFECKARVHFEPKTLGEPFKTQEFRVWSWGVGVCRTLGLGLEALESFHQIRAPFRVLFTRVPYYFGDPKKEP